MTAWTDAVSALAPYGWWKLNEASGSVATDYGSGAHNGTYISTANLTYGLAALIPGDTGGGSITVNTTSANMSVSSVLSYSSINCTYALTFKSSTDQTGRLFFATSTAYLNIQASTVSLVLASGTSVNFGWDPTTGLFDGNAHLIVVVSKATSAELWVDGTMVGSGSHAASSATLTSLSLKGASIGVIGGFDDLMLWTSQLSSTQIGDLWDAWQGGAVPEVDANLTGSGAFTATSTAAPAGNLTGSGALGATVAAVAAALLTGAGAFTATSYVPGEAIPVDGLLTGSGAFTATSSQIVSVDADLTGAGAFTASSLVAWQVAGEFTGSGAFTATSVEVEILVTDTTNMVGGLTLSGFATATWEPAVADPDVSLIGPIQHDYDKAAVFAAPTVTAGHVVATPPTIVAAARHRDRIIVGGKDVTFFRGVHTPTPTFRLVEPGLYGAGELVMPQVHSLFEQVGTGALKFLRPGQVVKVQRVDVETGEVVAEDYRGFITGKPKRGAGSSFPLGGELIGRMALKYHPRPIFKSSTDGGRMIYDAVRASAHRAFLPRLGEVTGIDLPHFGGMGELEHFQETLAKMVHANGNQWTVGLRETGFNPDGRRVGTWGMWVKDRTTIHATAYIDGDWLAPDFGDDISERPNRMFVEAVDKEGRRIDFRVLPGIRQGEAPPYPFNDERVFGEGTTDAETDTGSGITSMIHRLVVMGFLSRPAGADYEYDAQATAAIKRLQDMAGLTESGNMNVPTWEALYDLSKTGYSLTGTILPAAQTTKTKLWNRTASGALSTRNPNFDPHEIVRDRIVQMGVVRDKQQARQWSRDDLRDSNDQEWYGTLTCHFGLIRGEHNPGDPAPTSADVMSARELRPGMNVWAPLFEGGTLFHISAIEVPAGGRNPVLTLDTEARDTMEIWQIIQRNRESRENLARAFVGQYLSSKIGNDNLTTWNPECGLIDDSVSLTPGWNHFHVPVGQAGTLEKIRIQTDPPREFVASVSAREISDARMAHLIGNPFTEAGTERWEKSWVRDALEARIWLESWGEHEQPAGYSPRRKTDDNGEATGAPLTGVLEDAAGINFHTFDGQPVLWVSIYVADECDVVPGRIMWIQLDGSA